jgi:site-specific recombinase XerC
MAVLVDLDEVRSLVRGPDHGGLTGEALKDKLSTTSKVVASLIKHGHLKTMTVVNPVPTVVVPAEEFERFGKRYVSLFALAKQRAREIAQPNAGAVA